MPKRKSKRIGFVDLNLDNFHTKVFLHHIHDTHKKRGHRVVACTALKRRTGIAWAKKHGVAWCESEKELNEFVDCFLIAAPSNPEVHLPLARSVLSFGKPTYIDKPFAESLTVAKRICALADKHKAPIQTSSALRYSNVHDYVDQIGRRSVKSVVAYGGGTSFEEYGIHPVELAVSILGAGAVSLMRRGGPKQPQLLINFTGGRNAVVNVCIDSATPYAGCITTTKETKLIEVDTSTIFADTTAAILDFFESGKPNVPRAQSLMIRRILDVAQRPAARKRFVKL